MVYTEPYHVDDILGRSDIKRFSPTLLITCKFICNFSAFVSLIESSALRAMVLWVSTQKSDRKDIVAK